MLSILCSCGNLCAQSVSPPPILCARMSSSLGLRSASVALWIAVRCRCPIPSVTGHCVFSTVGLYSLFDMVLSVSLVFLVYLVSYVSSNYRQHTLTKS